jgi:hypothetical protein
MPIHAPEKRPKNHAIWFHTRHARELGIISYCIVNPIDSRQRDERIQQIFALQGAVWRTPAAGLYRGKVLIVERYSGEGRTAHYAELANEVVRQQPDVVSASSGRSPELQGSDDHHPGRRIYGRPGRQWPCCQLGTTGRKLGFYAS